MPTETFYLGSMRDRAKLVQQYIPGKSREDFLQDTMCQDAVLWRLSNIGEAAGKVAPATRAALPALPFESIKGMRNLVLHVYWQVDLEIVWKTATGDMAALVDTIDEFFQRATP